MPGKVLNVLKHEYEELIYCDTIAAAFNFRYELGHWVSSLVLRKL